MTTRRVVVSLLLVLVAALVFAPAARADSQARIVRLSLVDGAVQIDRGQGFEKAIMNMPITQGMKLSTADDARAEVEFEDGTTLRLAPRTAVEFPALGLRSSGARVTTVLVSQGTAYFSVRHKRDDNFRVAFANREITADRNVHFRLDLAGGNPELAVFKGDLDINDPQAHLTVKKNETLTFDVADHGGYDLAKSVAPESFDEWDNDRINYALQYASSSYNMHSPYYYGASDLNYYGSWNSCPGYGMMWRPFGVGYGWDPFYNGAWAWYPSFGYTWVSTYPWGWTPYRYGSWMFSSNCGWAWRPGLWNTWYTVPPVYNPPRFYHGPKPPPPVTVVGGGGRANPYPTVVVDNGVIRDHRKVGPAEGFLGGRNADTTVAAPAGAPAPGTGIAAPGSPIPIRGGPRPDMRPHYPGRGAPGPHPQPSPRASAPTAAHSAAPSGGGHSGGSHSSGGSRPPK
ncbi:MAG: FecR family protein [Acidobacteriia bacterium]|nr:FecR family protein [Terriglobia bacterium]